MYRNLRSTLARAAEKVSSTLRLRPGKGRSAADHFSQRQKMAHLSPTARKRLWGE